MRPNFPPLPLIGSEEGIKLEPVAFVEWAKNGSVKKGDNYTVLVKVCWENLPEEEATWEDSYYMEKRFPDFMSRQRLEVKASSQGGGSVRDQWEFRAKRPIELVHTDICGPITPASLGENWCGCSEHMDEMKSKIQITFFLVN